MPLRHLPVLDGLRAIAVLLVLWSHVPLAVAGYPEWLTFAHWLIGPGGLGVEIFFVLSGFLITRILIAERAQNVPVRWFLLRRLLRIFPIYYLLLLVMLPFRPLTEIGWCAAYLSNLQSIFWPSGGPLEHTWSLCVEEHFYLLWPLVVALAPRTLPPRLLAFGVMPAAVVGALVLCIVWPREVTAPAIQHGSPFRFLCLGAGCLMAYGEPQLRNAPRRAAALGAALLGLALLLHPHFVFLLGPVWLGSGEWLALRYEPAIWLVHNTSLGAGIVLLGIVGDGWRWSPFRLLCVAPLRVVGRISYGLYLYHLPIYWAVLHGRPTPIATVQAIALSFLAAGFSFWAIERPLLRYAARFRRAPVPNA